MIYLRFYQILCYIDLSGNHEDILYSNALEVNDTSGSQIPVSYFDAQLVNKFLIKFKDAIKANENP